MFRGIVLFVPAYPIYENATVTISVPLEPNNRNQIGPFPLVLGMQMKYTELQRKLEKILTSCGQYRRCDLTCLNDVSILRNKKNCGL